MTAQVTTVITGAARRGPRRADAAAAAAAISPGGTGGCAHTEPGTYIYACPPAHLPAHLQRRRPAPDYPGAVSGHGRAASICAASPSSSASRPARATNCAPIGVPPLCVPAGTLIAGHPARFHGGHSPA